MPGYINVNPKGPIPPESTTGRRAAGKQNVDTQPDAAKKPVLGVRRKPSCGTTQPNVTNKPEPGVSRKPSTPPPAKEAVATTPPLAGRPTVPPPPAAVKLPVTGEPPTAGQPLAIAIAVGPSIATGSTPQGAKDASVPPSDTTSPAITPPQPKATSQKDKKGTPPRIQLEKETKEEILAAISEVPGDDDNSSLISLQPSQSEVNIDVQKKVQNSAVVKAFNEAERRRASQS